MKDVVFGGGEDLKLAFESIKHVYKMWKGLVIVFCFSE